MLRVSARRVSYGMSLKKYVHSQIEVPPTRLGRPTPFGRTEILEVADNEVDASMLASAARVDYGSIVSRASSNRGPSEVAHSSDNIV